MTSSLGGSRGPTGNKIPKGYRTGRLQQYQPEQMDLFKSLFPYVSPGSKLAQQAQGSEEGFAPFEEAARRDFQANMGDLASRFTELAPGAMSARRGSGFKISAGQDAQDFALRLATHRQGLQRQALMDLLGISESLLGQRPTQQFLVQKQQKPSFWGRLFGAAAPVAGAALGGAFGGPGGAMLGGNIGSGIGQGANQWQPAQY